MHKTIPHAHTLLKDTHKNLDGDWAEIQTYTSDQTTDTKQTQRPQADQTRT